MKLLRFFLFTLPLYLAFPSFVFAQCASPTTGKGPCPAVNTAIGPISTEPGGAVSSIMTILLGFAGGVALLLIIGAGYQIMTSQGNPEKIKEARERLTSAIVGLLFLIFSAAILQIIGIGILGLPGFNPK